MVNVTDPMRKYPYIVAWGQMMGFSEPLISLNCRKAVADNAPKNATFYSWGDNRWRTLDDIQSEEVKAEVLTLVTILLNTMGN